MAQHDQSNNLEISTITRKLVQLEAFLGDLSPVMQEIAAILERDVTEAFQNERDPTTHNKWADLDSKTIKQRSTVDCAVALTCRAMNDVGIAHATLLSNRF